MPVAKIRLHRGVNIEFRRRLRSLGISVDSELAHRFLAAGPTGMARPLSDRVEEVRLDVLQAQCRKLIETEWERDHPDRNPYPPSFAERVLSLAKEIEGRVDEDLPVTYEVGQLIGVCRVELQDDTWVAGLLGAVGMGLGRDDN